MFTRGRLLLALFTGLALTTVGGAMVVARLDAVERRLEAALVSATASPARLYAQPYTVRTHGAYSPHTLEQELQRLGYRAVPQTPMPGTYVRDGATVRVHLRRAQDEVETRVRVVHPDRDSRAEVRDADGRLRAALTLEPFELGALGPYPDRRAEPVPTQLVAMLLAVEDRRFERHAGIDVRAVARAAWRNLRAGRIVEGGSTVSQQLARTLLADSRRTWSRKLDEALAAGLLERRLGKRGVLERYLDEVYLGEREGRPVRGFAAGARHWFGRPLGELDTAELALLVALVRGPSYYHPARAPERARARRDHVLRIAATAGVLPDDAARAAAARPLGLVAPRSSLAWHGVRERVLRELAGAGFEPAALPSAAVYTTIRPWEQDAAQAAIADGLTDLERRFATRVAPGLQAAVAVVGDDGAIHALVGGRVPDAGFNRAMDARRPIGSLVKPFVFLAALDSGGYHPASLVDTLAHDWYLDDGRVWRPADAVQAPALPLVRALAESSNRAAVNVGADVGLASVLDTLHALGLERAVRPAPALLLGALDLSPLEVASLYAGLANGGQRVRPYAVERVRTADGGDHGLPTTPAPAVARGTVHELAHMLVQTVERGTGRPLRRWLPAQVRVGGKTGTSSDGRDAWFAGFGQRHAIAVWVGRDDFRPTPLDGARGAAPLWGRVAHALQIEGWEPLPAPGLVAYWIDRDTGIVVPDACGGLAMQVLVAREVPLPWSGTCLPAMALGPVPAPLVVAGAVP